MTTGPLRVKQVRVAEMLAAALRTKLFEVKAMAERMVSQPEAEMGQQI